MSDRPDQDFHSAGEMGARIRGFDWSRTPLGSVAGWPESLKTTVRIMLGSRYPMFLWWGRELINLYNDAYIPVLGPRHPDALGCPGPQVWEDIWGIVGPQADLVLQGQATWNEELLLLMERYGFVEETYFTFSYSPVYQEAGGVGGVFCVCTDDTRQVLGERRLKTLRGLGEQSLSEARSIEQACRAAAVALAANPHDIPFALIYLLDAGGRGSLCSAVNLDAGEPASPEEVTLGGEADVWNLSRVLATGQSHRVEDLEARFGRLAAGPWKDDWTRRALVLPLAKAGAQEAPAGFLVAGVSPRLELNDEYRGFLDLAAGQIATAIANVRAYEEERRRAEALAEIDRAKTAFFSNVSHEFRTPLTLMLGPMEDTLARSDTLSGEDRERLEVAHRNGLRLLNLVNTLLDFSRIEAGRIEASYEPTDLPAFTAELASLFRSAVERAGLRLVIDCPPEAEPVWVDREMWEKIVFNLLSNAFKFTFEGEIEVRLRRADGEAALTVRDTGTGIPAAELEHVFERFHRVRGARGRSFEGSGIGLALVQELVKLHGGAVDVESEEGRGTAFTVRIPTGTAHLPADRIGASRALASTGLRAETYVEEAFSWLPAEAPAGPAAAPAARILLADDNADLREYVRRLLAERYEVEAVGDGLAALAAVRERPPDLVLSDVMMPGLDGFGLLAELRADDRTKGVPVILLSARAGEESKVEGLEAGADDYLIKPFSARELLARVEAHLKMARLRREGAHLERALRGEAVAAREVLESVLGGIRDQFLALDPEFRYVYLNDRVVETTGKSRGELLGRNIFEVFPETVGGEFEQALRRAMAGRAPVGFEYFFPVWNRWFENRVYPTAAGLTLLVSDITERKRAEEALRESEERLRASEESLQAALDGGALGAWSWDPVTGLATLDARTRGLFVLDPGAEVVDGREVFARIHPDDQPAAEASLRGALEPGREYYAEFRVVVPGAPVRWLAGAGRARLDASGRVTQIYGVNYDITARKQAEEALREADRRKDEFLAMLAHELRNPLSPIRNAVQVLRLVGSEDARQRWAREVIERQTQHLTRLVDDLLDVSRITRGKVTLANEPLDLAAIVHRAVEASRPLIDARRHHLTVAVPPEPVWLEGDLTRLVQVAGNLLNNAAKYTDEGGEILIEAAREDGEAVVRVRDNGMGVHPDLLPYVFDLFTQADRSLDRSQGGLGIGLTLVRQLVELHGGRVEARSAGPGQGSEFTVRLPALAPELPAAAPGAAEAARTSARALRILVVEDNPDSAEMMSFLLELGGHEVRTAHDGPAALEAARAFAPEVVLCDIGLPGMTGYEVAARLRELPALRHASLIALTGYGQEEARRRSREAGFDHHLVKPVEPQALQALLDSLRAGRLAGNVA